MALYQQLGVPSSIMGFDIYGALDQMLVNAYRNLGEEKFREVFEKLIASMRADCAKAP